VLTVVANQDWKPDGGVVVYNFQVEGDHTYFVGDIHAQGEWVWTHNACSVKESYKTAVAEATGRFKGNVTVARDGVTLFRVHQIDSGHGYKVTQFVRRPRPSDGVVFNTKREVPVRKTHVMQLERALRGDPRYQLLTKGRR
jgi:hypothetical protein